MLPSQIFELADDIRYHGYEDEDPNYMTRLAAACEFEDDCNIFDKETVFDHYNTFRHLNRGY